MKAYKVLTINPGSTSTKIGLFEGTNKIFDKNVEHDAARLDEFPTLADQYLYRKRTIDEALKENNIFLDGLDAVVGRGGGLLATEGGTYEIDEVLLDHSKRCANGVIHPACLGPSLAMEYANMYGIPAFVVNPPDTDELQMKARMTGVKGVYRNVHLHALNLKETAIRFADSCGKKYEDCNFIVCHIGGGISVSAHRHGRMIDGNDIVGGDGPMTPTRCGQISVVDVLKLCGENDLKAVKSLCTKSGGFVSHLGTSDGKAVYELSRTDDYAALVFDTMIYQIQKYIGAMAAALEGNIDAILIGGGLAYNEKLVTDIKNACGWIAPIHVFPGEFELEAMAAGAVRVLEGVETAKKYTGVPVFSGI